MRAAPTASPSAAGHCRPAPKHYEASGNTVRDAIKWLASLGLVETKPGQGTFVVQKIAPYIANLTADPKVPTPYGEVDRSDPEGNAEKRLFSSTAPQVEIQKASLSIADQLQVAEGSRVVSRHQKRYIDETPWSMQTSFYPMAFALQGASQLILAEDIEVGTVKYLADTLGLRQVGYRDWISVWRPDAAEAVFFSLPQDGRVGVYEIRTAFDQTRTPTRFTVTVLPRTGTSSLLKLTKPQKT